MEGGIEFQARDAEDFAGNHEGVYWLAKVDGVAELFGEDIGGFNLPRYVVNGEFMKILDIFADGALAKSNVFSALAGG